MFAFYKKHNNHLYNKLVELSRNIFFYKDCGLKDTFETRVILIFVHLSILVFIQKKKKAIFDQKTYDNIFLNIEYGMRELGYGDVTVNKNMKLLNKIFYDILIKINVNEGSEFSLNNKVIEKHLSLYSSVNASILGKIEDYFYSFFKFCLDLENNVVLMGKINFKYK